MMPQWVKTRTGSSHIIHGYSSVWLGEGGVVTACGRVINEWKGAGEGRVSSPCRQCVGSLRSLARQADHKVVAQ